VSQRSSDHRSPAPSQPSLAHAERAPAPDIQNVTEPPTSLALLSMQRLAGNRATAALARQLSVQREDTPTAPPADAEAKPADAEAKRLADLEASYLDAVKKGDWKTAGQRLNEFNDEGLEKKVKELSHDQLISLDAGSRESMPTSFSRVTDAITKADGEADRVGKLTADYDGAIAKKDWGQAIVFLNGFNDTDIISKLNSLAPTDLAAMKTAAQTATVGGGRMKRFADAVSGTEVKTQSNEQVGGRVYTVQGRYTYQVAPDAIRISVGMNFKPDQGVAVPTATWFGYIREIWNHFSAVNKDNPVEKKAIEFVPTAGPGHDIQVSSGDGRANAAHYYTGASDLKNVLAHEFGHLIGLEDEYERDAADYERVTGDTAPAGSGDEAKARDLAKGIHDGLFKKEGFFERHKTAERRRIKAVNDVLKANAIVPNYQAARSVFTRLVSIQYATTYGHEMSKDFMSQVNTNEDEFNTWREQVLGSFQVTSGSIMGDMKDHTHPVEPRHVRAFAGYVQTVMEHGTWEPKLDH
jgi:hypothetical protein